jgi:3-oxoacyl-[acyl-carrier-protein] synthase III
MLSSWKPERLPDYILCVSTNTLFQHVSFSGPALPAYLYGDGAAAFVLSPRHAGKFKIVDSYLERRGFLRPSTVVERHVSFREDGLLPSQEVQEMISQGLQRSSQFASPKLVVGPQLYSGEFSRYEEALGMPKGSFISGTHSTGYALGASYGVALSSLWGTVSSGTAVAVLHVGDGVWSGSVVLAS